jgi:hypothetical protein
MMLSIMSVTCCSPTARLTKLSVGDVDAGKEQLDVTIYASYGLMSTESQEGATRGSRTISLRGGILDLNAALGNIFYFNSMVWMGLQHGLQTECPH